MHKAMLLLLVMISGNLYADDDFDRQQIQQRIKPVGQVSIQETAVTNPATGQEEKPATTKKLSGQDIFEKYCHVCHTDGLLGAPKFRSEADWKPRLAKAKSIDGLVAVAMKGLNAMPAKGTCEECNEADIKAAIEYMVSQK